MENTSDISRSSYRVRKEEKDLNFCKFRYTEYSGCPSSRLGPARCSNIRFLRSERLKWEQKVK